MTAAASSDAAAVVTEAQKRTEAYLPRIVSAISSGSGCVSDTDIPQHFVQHGGRRKGKVRDTYELAGDTAMLIVTTDRQSAFDRVLASVPFKGSVLNLCSAWWCEETEKAGIVKNHVLGIPHPNVTVARKCTVFTVEFVMRGYLTGSTSTSIWKNYEKGVRQYCGHTLPEGLRKNQRLPMGNILTPTSKDDEHDELMSAAEVVSSGRMTQEQWDACSDISHRLFAFGQQVAAQRGLILVDTKYELGVAADGSILLVDEIHTPDSSRYWVAESYESRFEAGQDPENIDKEFLRKWFASNCDPYADAELPAAPEDLVAELSRRYIMLYEMITGKSFEFPSESKDAISMLNDDVGAYFKGEGQAFIAKV